MSEAVSLHPQTSPKAVCPPLRSDPPWQAERWVFGLNVDTVCKAPRPLTPIRRMPWVG